MSLQPECIFALDRAVSLLTPATSAESRFLWPVISLNVTDHGGFGGVDTIELNNIFELHDTEPEFLVDFKTELRQRCWVEPNIVCFFFIIPF